MSESIREFSLDRVSFPSRKKHEYNQVREDDAHNKEEEEPVRSHFTDTDWLAIMTWLDSYYMLMLHYGSSKL
jgi:hypothetical protein